MTGDDCCTSILNKVALTPYLMPGRIVRILPDNIWGFFRVPFDAVPEFLPEKTVNLATLWSNSLPAMQSTGNQSTVLTKVTAWDVPSGSLGHYRLFAKDHNILYHLFQPPTQGRFRNNADAIPFTWSGTNYALSHEMWNLLPEIFIFEDETPPTLQATSANMREATFQVRVSAIGFRYPIEHIDLNETDANGQRIWPDNVNKIPSLKVFVGNSSG